VSRDSKPSSSPTVLTSSCIQAPGRWATSVVQDMVLLPMACGPSASFASLTALTQADVDPFRSSYDACDLGTLPNQTNVAGTGPAAALNSGSKDYGGRLSYLPGQKLSACTCAGGDHPGPNVGVGRGAPEIDIIEA
jgi:hypothetical protein